MGLLRHITETNGFKKNKKTLKDHCGRTIDWEASAPYHDVYDCESHHDEFSGETYCYSKRTGETTWKGPDNREVQVQAKLKKNHAEGE